MTAAKRRYPKKGDCTNSLLFLFSGQDRALYCASRYRYVFVASARAETDRFSFAAWILVARHLSAVRYFSILRKRISS